MTRLQQAWCIIVQLVTLGLATLALVWFQVPERATPDAPSVDWSYYQAARVLLLGFIIISLVVACVPRWRRGEIGAILGGLGLAIACWLAVDKTWDIAYFSDAYIPQITPFVVGGAVLFAVLGLLVRVGIGGQSRWGKAALAGMLLVGATCLLFYFFFHHSAFFLDNYAFELYQVKEILAAALLYPTALWLGSTGIRQAGRLTLLPLTMPVLFAVFLVLWRTR